MNILNYITEYNLAYYLVPVTVGILGYIFIKSYLNPTVDQTPNEPQTFNFTPEQMREINVFLDNDGVLNQETNEKLDQDLKTIMGEENYNNFIQESKQIEEEMLKSIQDILENVDNFL
jgi:hypothetical protein